MKNEFIEFINNIQKKQYISVSNDLFDWMWIDVNEINFSDDTIIFKIHILKNESIIKSFSFNDFILKKDFKKMEFNFIELYNDFLKFRIKRLLNNF